MCGPLLLIMWLGQVLVGVDKELIVLHAKKRALHHRNALENTCIEETVRLQPLPSIPSQGFLPSISRGPLLPNGD